MYSLLNATERKDFSAWLAFETGKSQHDLRLLDGLIDAATDKKSLWESIHPEKPYKDDAFRKLCNRLLKKLEHFLAQTQFAVDFMSHDLKLIEALARRKAAFGLFQAEFKKVMKRLENQPLRNATYFRQLYELQRWKHSYLIAHPSKRLGQHTRLVAEAQSLWLLHEELLTLLMAANLQLVQGQELPVHTAETAWNQLRAYEPLAQRAPLLYLYHQIYKTLTAAKTEQLSPLWAFAQTHRASMLPDELKNIYNLLLNIYLRQANQEGEATIYQQALTYYESGLQQGLLLVNGQLPPAHYKNIIHLALRVEKARPASTFDKPQAYLHELKALLPAEKAGEVFRLSKGTCHYFQGEHRAAKKLLGTPFKEVGYEVQARMYLLQMMYEADPQDSTALAYSLRNLGLYLQRKEQLPPVLKKAWENRLRIFRQLLKFYLPEQLHALKNEVKSLSLLNDRTWLLEQIERKIQQRGWP